MFGNQFLFVGLESILSGTTSTRNLDLAELTSEDMILSAVNYGTLALLVFIIGSIKAQHYVNQILELKVASDGQKLLTNAVKYELEAK